MASVLQELIGSVSPVFQLANIRIILNTSKNQFKFGLEFGAGSCFLSRVTSAKTTRPSTICKAVCDAMSTFPNAAPVMWNCSGLTAGIPEADLDACSRGRNILRPNRSVVW